MKETKENIMKLREAHDEYQSKLLFWETRDEDEDRTEAWDAEEVFHEICKTIPSLTKLCEEEARLAREINTLDIETQNFEVQFRNLREVKTALINSLIKEAPNDEVHSKARKRD